MPLDGMLGNPMPSANLPVQPLAEEDDDVLDRMPGGIPWPPPPDPIPVWRIPSVPRRLHMGRWGTWTCMTGEPTPTGIELVVLPSDIAPDGWVGVDVDLGRGLRGRVVWMGHFGVYWQCLVLQYQGDRHSVDVSQP